jgi:hypothetical protein
MFVFSVIVMVVSLLPACSHNTRIISPEQAPPVSLPPPEEPAQVLVIEDVQIVQNGQAGNIDPGFVQRFASEMRRSGLFRTVYDPANAYNAPKDAIRMKLYVSEMLDRRWAEKVGKDILVGLSYLALMPVMPYKMDYNVSLRAAVILPGKDLKEFESSTKAAVDYKGFSDSKAAEDDLKRAAMNDCLNGLVVKMKTNEGFLLALQPE